MKLSKRRSCNTYLCLYIGTGKNHLATKLAIISFLELKIVYGYKAVIGSVSKVNEHQSTSPGFLTDSSDTVSAKCRWRKLQNLTVDPFTHKNVRKDILAAVVHRIQQIPI